MRLMSKGDYVIVPKRTKFTGSGKLGLNLATQLQLLQLFSIKDYRKGHGEIPTFLPLWWYSKIKHGSLCHSGGVLTSTVITNRGQMIGVGQQLRNTYDELAETHPPFAIHIGPDRKKEVLNLATQLQLLQLFSIKDYRKGHGEIPTFLPLWWYSKIKHVQSLPFWCSFNIYCHYKSRSNDWSRATVEEHLWWASRNPSSFLNPYWARQKAGAFKLGNTVAASSAALHQKQERSWSNSHISSTVMVFQNQTTCAVSAILVEL